MFAQLLSYIFLQMEFLLQPSNSPEIGLHTSSTAAVVIDYFKDSVGEEDEKDDRAHYGHIAEENLGRIARSGDSIAD